MNRKAQNHTESANDAVLPCILCANRNDFPADQSYVLCDGHPKRSVIPRPLEPDLHPNVGQDEIIDPGCPVCGGSDGYMNWADFQYKVCSTHAAWWWIGDALTDSWLFESAEEQDRVHDEVSANYRDVTLVNRRDVQNEYLDFWYAL